MAVTFLARWYPRQERLQEFLGVGQVLLGCETDADGDAAIQRSLAAAGSA